MYSALWCSSHQFVLGPAIERVDLLLILCYGTCSYILFRVAYIILEF
jgi:hypothetical protein